MERVNLPKSEQDGWKRCPDFVEDPQKGKRGKRVTTGSIEETARLILLADKPEWRCPDWGQVTEIDVR